MKKRISFEKFENFMSGRGHKICVVYSENRRVKLVGCKSKAGNNYVIFVPDRYALTVNKKDGLVTLEIRSVEITPSSRQLDYITDVGDDIFVQNSSLIVTSISKKIDCYIRASNRIITGNKVDILEKEVESKIKVSKKIESVQENKLKQIEEELDKISKVEKIEEFSISPDLSQDVDVKNIEQADIIVGCILPFIDLKKVLEKDDLEQILSEKTDKINLVVEEHLKVKTEKVVYLLNKITMDFNAKISELNQSLQTLTEQKIKLAGMYHDLSNEKTDTTDLKSKIVETTNSISLDIFTKRSKLDLILTDYEITLGELIQMLK